MKRMNEMTTPAPQFANHIRVERTEFGTILEFRFLMFDEGFPIFREPFVKILLTDEKAVQFAKVLTEMTEKQIEWQDREEKTTEDA